MKFLRTGVVLVAVLAVGCGRDSPTTPSPQPGIRPGTATAVLIGAGDIGLCGSAAVAATGRIVEANAGEVVLAGDIAYPTGAAVDFRDCFDPFWGHARDRWHASPGNHEYMSPNAAPYFDYFGPAAGARGAGFHRFIAGEWLVLMLNSEIPSGVGSAQYDFARTLLETRPSRCQLAVWHRPLFSSGPNGPNPEMQDLWRLLDAHGVDAIVTGHDHLYERFAPQDADGRPDQDGIRQFIVGTGGAELYGFVRQAPNSIARLSAHGVIRFSLNPESYSWEFLLAGGGIGDAGFAACR